jgi:F-type H+-transporting ATPase subunit b
VNDAFYEQVAIWSQVVASILFLGVLVFLWVRFITPAVIASRNRKNAELGEAERRRDEARAEIERARAEVAAAEEDAHAIVARAEADARRLRDRILAEATAEGARLLQNAEGELERGRAAARDELRASLVTKALGIAREASRGLDARTNRRLIEETVAVADRDAQR